MKLNSSWILWLHLPYDNDWSIDSYKKITSFSTIEDAVSVIEYMDKNIFDNYLLFIMREGILPLWEDETNIKGGCFSYKISNNNINNIWKEVSYRMIGETLNKNNMNINGITLSNKKKFFIFKIWCKTLSNKNPTQFPKIDGLNEKMCVFKEHSNQ
tara:strand:+ start:197 stop:664 length:468 start_codon:yes stop_codon:yes gene_type:complete